MGSTAITHPARESFDVRQIALIRNTVAKDCNEHEFRLFLEIAAAHDLNPMTGEIYASKMGGQNGSAGRVVMIVGRNGWMKIARRHDDFIGIDSDVVRENDKFSVARTADGTRTIQHSYEGTSEARGAIKGAWACVERRGAKPTYFFAPIEEYKPTSAKKLEYSPWGTQESVMMEKCARVTALRLTYSIGGVYDEAEMARLAAEGPVEVNQEIAYGEDSGVANRLRALIPVARELDDSMYRDALLRVRLNDATDEEREEFAREIEKFIVSRGGTIPDPPVDGEVEEVEGEVEEPAPAA